MPIWGGRQWPGHACGCRLVLRVNR
jgi:hypothetical protein